MKGKYARRKRRPELARSVYRVHVIDPTTSEQIGGHVGAVITELLAAATAGTIGGGSTLRLTLELVEIRSGSVVLTMREFADDAHRLASLVDTDLDRLDADAFAKEWGFPAR